MTDYIAAAILSDKIYENLGQGDIFGPSNRYQVLSTSSDFNPNSSTGYYGAIIKDIQTNKVFLASRGTEITSIQDLVADISLGLGGLAGNQYSDAIQFLNNYETNNQNNPNYIPVTESVGHSLGGYIAQLVGVSKGYDITVFGSPGADGGLDDLENLGVDVDGYDKSRITSVEAEHDPIVGTGTEISGINTVMINVEDRVDQTLTGQLASSYAHMVSLTGFDEINVFSSLGNYTFALTAFGAKLVYHNPDYYRGEIAGDYTQTVSSSALLGFASTENGDTVNFYEQIAVVDSVSGADTIFYQKSDGNIYALVNQTDGTKALSYKDYNGDAVLKTFASLDDMSNLTAQEQYIAQEIIYQKYLAERRAAEELFNDNPDIANSTEYANLPQEVKDQIDDHLANGQVVSDESAMTGEVISGDLGSDPLGVGNGNDGLGIGSGDFNALQLVWVVQNGSKEHQIQAALQLYSKIKTDGVYDSSTDTYTLDGATIENVSNSFGGSAVKLSYGGIAQSYITLYDQGDFQQKVVETVGLDGRTNSAQITLADGLVNEIYRGEPVKIHYPENFVFGYAGGYIANIVGQQLANGELAHDIISSSITRTLGQNLGEVLDFLSTGQNDLREAFFDPIFGVNGAHAPRPDILDDFLSNLQVSVLSAVSTQIVGELGDAIGIEGVGGEIFDVTAGTITTGITKELFGIIFNDMPAGVYSTLANAGFDFSSGFYDPSLDPNFNPNEFGPYQPNTTVGDYVQAQVVSVLASYAGNRLAGEVISPESEMAGIFGSIGSAIGTYIGTATAATGSTLASLQAALQLGTAFGPVGIAIGAFVGTVFGTALGNAFGGEDNPASWAEISYNYNSGEYFMSGNWGNDGGDTQISAQMAQSVVDGINNIIDLTQGTLRSSSYAPDVTVGWKKGTFVVHVDGEEIGGFDNSGDAILTASLHLMKNFDLVGGHAVLMRAWHNSEAMTINEFKEDLQVAEAFQQYLLNPAGILALMIDQPDSALAQSWAAILQRVAELELHLPHEKDLDGGWGELLLARGDLDPEDIPRIDGDSIVVTDPVTGEETVIHHVIGPGYEIVRFEGTDGNDTIEIIVDGPSITYVDAGAGNDIIEGSDERDIIVGGDGDDTINGNAGDDWLHGGSGNDTINGNGGIDLIAGGNDDDFIEGGTQNDIIYGGAGNDIIYGRGGQDKLYGGDGDDQLFSETDTFGDDLYGGDGNDLLDFDTRLSRGFGGKGNDHIILRDAQNIMYFSKGDGHDTVELLQISGPNVILFDSSISLNDISFSQSGLDLIVMIVDSSQTVKIVDAFNFSDPDDKFIIQASNGYATLDDPTGAQTWIPTPNEVIDWIETSTNGSYYSSGLNTIILADSGDNVITANAPATTAYGGAGNDVFNGYTINGDRSALFYGDAGNDLINGSGANDKLYGGSGDDYIKGDRGDDIIYGEAGNDVIEGGDDHDFIHGGAGDDEIDGDLHNDEIHGGLGNDTITDTDGDNTVFGDEGNDIITTGSGQDSLDGGADDDILNAGAGNDRVLGGSGNDLLNGGEGDDRLEGGSGSDGLDGGIGNDVLFGGDDDDVLEFNILENIGYSNVYNGGVGFDSLNLYFTSTEIIESELQHELLVFNQFISQYQNSAVDENNIYEFFSFDLRAKSIETLNVFVNGASYDIQQNFVAGAWHDNVSLTVNQSRNIDVLVNDLVPDGGSLNISSLGAASYGSAILNDDGTVKYTPTDNYIGTDSFTYNVDDGLGNITTGIVTLSIEPLNKAPIATADIATMSEEASVTIDVLANDSDRENDTIFILATSQALHGSVVLNQDGTITYTSEQGFIGTDDIYYLIKDSAGGYTTGTASVDVTAGSFRNSYSGTSGNDTINTGNDSGRDIVYGSSGNDRADVWYGDDIFVYSGGLDEIFASGFSHDTIIMDDYTLDDVEFVASDRNNDGYINHLKVIVDENVNELMVIHGVRTDNVSYRWEEIKFADGFSLAIDDYYQWINTDDGDSSDNVIFGDSNANTMSGNSGDDQMIGYAGDDVLHGDDGNDQIYGGEGNDTLSGGNGSDKIWGASGDDILIYDVHANIQSSDLYDGGEGHDTLRVDLTASDLTDVSLVHELRRYDNFISRYTNNTTAEQNVFLFLAFALMTKSVEAMEVYVDSVQFDIHQNFAPEVQNEEVDMLLNGSVTVDVLNNDSDMDSHVLSVQSVGSPLYGDVQINADDSITYTPNSGHTGEDTFSYIVDDGNGGQTVGTVTIDVRATNAAPVLVEDIFSIVEDTQTVFDVLGNDSDPENDVLNIEMITNTLYGTAILNADNSITYTPDTNFIGTDSFFYVAKDALGDFSAQKVSITVSLDGSHIIRNGTSGDDTYDANDSAHNDVFYFGSGNDFARGWWGEDIFYYKEGLDTVFSKGADTHDIIYMDNDYTIDDATISATDYTYATSTSGSGYFDHMLVEFDANNKIVIQSSIRTDNTTYTWEKIYFSDGFSLSIDDFNNWIYTQDGNSSDNVIWGDANSNNMSGNAGNDEIIGYAGDDVIYGNIGNDSLYGGSDNDQLYGGDGSDKLWGADGDDLLNGQNGSDILHGGAGADVFKFSNVNEGLDIIKDFSIGENDVLDISDILDSIYDPLNDAIADFVKITASNGHSILSIDNNGGGDEFISIAILENASGLTDIDALIANQNLIV
tara:strand:- start:682567 stop:690534 length:7968 start_codon:yes stop_codon:yes gene_type:complete